MKEIVIISGKGGTGKTSLAAAVAMLSEKSVVCDADVDAADLHLLLQPHVEKKTDFMGGGLAIIDPARCTKCGNCLHLCRFGAISEDFTVAPIGCEGCGVCVDLCPEKAIDFPTQKCGEWYVSTMRHGPFIHAQLGIGEENSGKLVSLVRRQATELAENLGCELIITDGPPGIGCPVIASITGATGLVVVVEPTLSGMHDMARVLDLAATFSVPGMVCINKFDLNIGITREIEAQARARNIILLGRIPFDPVFIEAMVEGKNILEYQNNSEAAKIVKDVWQKIVNSPVLQAPQMEQVSIINRYIQPG